LIDFSERRHALNRKSPLPNLHPGKRAKFFAESQQAEALLTQPITF
jgi:hypothetical protein